MNRIAQERHLARAFTLLEVILYIGILSILLLSSLTVFPFFNSGFQKQNIQAQLSYEGAYVLDIFSYYVHQSTPYATHIYSPDHITLSNGTSAYNFTSENKTEFVSINSTTPTSLINSRITLTNMLYTPILSESSTTVGIEISFTLSETSGNGIKVSEDFNKKVYYPL